MSFSVRYALAIVAILALTTCGCQDLHIHLHYGEKVYTLDNASMVEAFAKAAGSCGSSGCVEGGGTCSLPVIPSASEILKAQDEGSFGDSPEEQSVKDTLHKYLEEHP
ncbi:MAG TPA: hypothetical protein PKY77_05730 [Phycisphaerae bacterium]|nr:hypothetical protein [Phycisphaerae bacterium]HRY69056.1 hypothetical protein [Phycisphaerae bacterium]HSA25969.1 hypothetical protein [Phycisphaerae bacterium]